MQLTQKQVNKKYKWWYIEFTQSYDYDTRQRLYQVSKKSKTIIENMTLWQDVGTNLEYTR